MVAKRDEWISIEDFLALDRESLDQKYEYRNGPNCPHRRGVQQNCPTST
jgi:hypothetical protein